MALEQEISDVMRLRGFNLVRQASSYIWYTKPRQGHWTDVFCFHLHSRLDGFTLSFGVEHAGLRSKILALASELSPTSYSGLVAPPFNFLERPSIVTFPAAVEDPAVRTDPAIINIPLIDSIESEYFESIHSDIRYLNFLKGSSGIFDWRRSATAFRLLYVGYLFHSLEMTSAEFAEFCLSIPKKTLEAHALLREEGWTAESYVNACIKRLWL